MIGRDKAIAAVVAPARRPRHRRLVTLARPGRHRQEPARDRRRGGGRRGSSRTARSSCRSRTCWSPSCSCRRSGTRSASARRPGLPLEERLALALDERRMLFVLDNFEQIVERGPDPGAAVHGRAGCRRSWSRAASCCASAASGCTTCRPLATHDPASPDSVARARTAPAVELFVDRARAAKPDVRADRRERSPRWSGSAARSRACRSRSSSPRRACACSRRPTSSSRLDRQLAAAGRLVARPARAAAHAAIDDRMVGRAAATTHPPPALRARACSRRGSRWSRSRRSERLREWDFDAFDALETLVDSSLVDQTDVRRRVRLLAAGERARVRRGAAAPRRARRMPCGDAHAAVYTERRPHAGASTRHRRAAQPPSPG